MSDSYFVIMSSQACMPANCWGNYRRIAVLEILCGCKAPKIITERAHQVTRIVQAWERLHSGLGIRDAYSRAYAEAIALCDRLNAEN